MMGYSVRTSDWRYMAYVERKLLVGDFDRIVAEELYNIRTMTARTLIDSKM